MARRLGIIEKIELPHRLTDIDTEQMTATCSDCGLVPILKQGKGYCCQPRARVRAAAHKAKNLERLRAYHREYNRRYKFGFSRDEIDAILDRDGLCCEICSRTLTRRQARLDHDHACCPAGSGCKRCFRGILCNGCNAAIGMLQESEDIFARAIAYLGLDVKVIGESASTLPMRFIA